MSPLYLLIPIFLGLGALAFGGVFFYFGLRSRRQASAAGNWPSAAGQVTAVSIHTQTNYSSEGAPSVSYQPVVEYDYTVIGTPYHGSRVAFGADSFGRRQAEGVLAKYPPGTSVTVYYNPDKPEEAVLEKSAQGTLLFMIVGGVIAFMGVCFGCLGTGVILLAMSGGK